MDELVDELIEFISVRKHVSFVELDDWLSANALSTKGELCIAMEGYPNIVFLAGMSKDFVEILMLALEKEEIFIHASTSLVYLVNGRHLTFPVAKSLRQYKTPRWLVLLSIFRWKRAEGYRCPR